MKTLFDHLSHIFEKQNINYFDMLDDVDKKTYNVYMISRFVSMNVDYLPIANELQQYWNQIGPRESYLFFSQALPKKKQFNKYIKSSTEHENYEGWLLSLIARHFEISLTEADDYLKLYYSSSKNKEELKKLLVGYGIDENKIKKARLG